MLLELFWIFFIKVSIAEGSNLIEFDGFEEYVEHYINSTLNYKLPTDNSQMITIDDDSITDYGTYDFIIIGGGSAGTILARRLVETKKVTILLLEAGGMYDNFTEIPAMSVYTTKSPFDWGYKTVPQKRGCQGMENKQCQYPRGKGLGGSHITNEMVYARGNRQNYYNWLNLGLKGWSYDDILYYFKKTEHDDTNDPKHNYMYHGFDGLLHINYTEPLSKNYDEFIQACKQIGLEETDINGASQIGVQRVPLTIKNKKRQMGGNAFIHPVLGQKNLKLVLNAFVTELLIRGRFVNGVKFVKDRKTHIAMASKEVLLCAGAINSPQILMLSGIGPKDELEKHNIPVRNHLPVGKYLKDHPAFLGFYVRTNQVYPNLTLADNLQRYMNSETPFTSPLYTQNIAFANTRVPGENPPDIELITSNPPLSVPSQQFFNLDDIAYEAFRKYNKLTDFLIYIVSMNPVSNGYVKLQSGSPIDQPLINPGYLTDANGVDIDTLFNGIQLALNLTRTDAMRSINATVVSNFPRCEHLKSDVENSDNKEYWYCAIEQSTTTLFHPCCTTRMGVSPRNSVVDSEFRVHNMRKLRVCDAGAMPEITAGHLLAPVTMMAEKLADMLIKQYC